MVSRDAASHHSRVGVCCAPARAQGVETCNMTVFTKSRRRSCGGKALQVLRGRLARGEWAEDVTPGDQSPAAVAAAAVIRRLPENLGGSCMMICSFSFTLGAIVRLVLPHHETRVWLLFASPSLSANVSSYTPHICVISLLQPFPLSAEAGLPPPLNNSTTSPEMHRGRRFPSYWANRTLENHVGKVIFFLFRCLPVYEEY